MPSHCIGIKTHHMTLAKWEWKDLHQVQNSEAGKVEIYHHWVRCLRDLPALETRQFPFLTETQTDRELYHVCRRAQRRQCTGLHRGHLLYFTQCSWQSHTYSNPECMLQKHRPEQQLRCEDQSELVGAGHIFGVLTERTGRWVVQCGCVTLPLFTSRNRTPLRINHNVPLASDRSDWCTAVTYMHNIYANVHVRGCVCVYTTEVHYALILLLLTLPLFCRIPLQPQIICITPLSHLFVVVFLFRRCLRSFSPRFLCRSGFIPAQTLLVFSAGLASLGSRSWGVQRLLEHLG